MVWPTFAPSTVPRVRAPSTQPRTIGAVLRAPAMAHARRSAGKISTLPLGSNIGSETAALAGIPVKSEFSNVLRGSLLRGKPFPMPPDFLAAFLCITSTARSLVKSGDVTPIDKLGDRWVTSGLPTNRELLPRGHVRVSHYLPYWQVRWRDMLSRVSALACWHHLTAEGLDRCGGCPFEILQEVRPQG